MSELFSIQLQNQQQSRDGVWLDLPTTTEQVQAALRQIGISSDNPQGLFATGVPPYIYAFHRYTWNSTILSHTLALRFPWLTEVKLRSFTTDP